MSGIESTRTHSNSEHYFALDVVRVLAAIAVLFWHYQHFFMPSASTHVTEAQRSLSPLYALFSPLYDYGYISVQIFWILSGFVFAAVYVERAATNASFFWARFARLYPLHLLTLVVVATLQYTSVVVVGHEQIYSNNDLYHFILQIFFASDWGWQHGSSFNGPIWSVSVEVLLYLAFWIVLPIIKKGQPNIPLAITFFCWLMANFSGAGFHIVWVGGSYFFGGVTIWSVQSRTQTNPIVISCTAGLSLVFGIGILVNRPDLENILAVPLIAAGILGLALAVDRTSLRRYCEPAKSFGDLTYGIYLWHVPVQIAALTALQYWGASQLAYSPFFLLGFFATVLFVAAVSFRHFETPMRIKFRRAGQSARMHNPFTNVTG